jgi:hypothetical protein
MFVPSIIAGMNHLRYFFLFAVIGFCLSSCVKKANYSDIPYITYNSFSPFCSGSTTDSAYLRVNFQDGDGDIGYDAQDASAPFDFYVMELVNYNGTYVGYPYLQLHDSLIFSYHIPYITPTGKDKSLNGIIQINLESNLQNSIPPTTIPGYNFHNVEFQVWIFDRAGNKSNVITTPPLTLCQ